MKTSCAIAAYVAKYRDSYPDDEFEYSDAHTRIYVPAGHLAGVILMQQLKTLGATSFSDLTLTSTFTWAFGCTVCNVVGEVQVGRSMVTVLPVPTLYDRLRRQHGCDPLPVAEFVHKCLVSGEMFEADSVAWAPFDWDFHKLFPATRKIQNL